MSLARAIETGDLAELPSRRDEDWRWSDFRGFVRELPHPAAASALPPAAGPFADDAMETLLIVNGRGPSDVAIGAGEDRSLVLRFVAADTGAQTSRLRIEVGAGASLTLLESHEGEAVSQTDVDVVLAADARVERIVIADEGASAVSVTNATVAMTERSQFFQTIVTTGGRRQRIETRIRHPGSGAKARLDSLYLIGGRRHSDVTTVVIHDGPDGDTEQVTRGVAAGQGRGIFQGRIEVRPGADRTNARMRHQALVLSDKAEVDAKPELEIYADDVSCSHGNSIGALDEEALFYARQRGIPEEAARSMLTTAFLDEVIDRIGHDGAREAVREFVGARMASLA